MLQNTLIMLHELQNLIQRCINNASIKGIFLSQNFRVFYKKVYDIRSSRHPNIEDL